MLFEKSITDLIEFHNVHLFNLNFVLGKEAVKIINLDMKLAPKPVKEISQDGITLNQATTLLGDTIYDSKPTHEK